MEKTELKYDTPAKRKALANEAWPSDRFNHRDDSLRRLGYEDALMEYCEPLEASLHTLMEYAQHRTRCQKRYTSYHRCDCGLDEILSRLTKTT